MSNHLPKEVRLGLRGGGAKRGLMRVEAGGIVFDILRLSPGGFVVDAKDAPKLRGLVNVHDGAGHVSQCLVVAGDTEDGETRFEYKRRTPVQDMPPLDFELVEAATTALADPSA
ncbi:hypothetical protein [Oceaniglobus roseus]|uniref:hypothetical protein n=1 Tax=Oceaniglobus roseus TaxID=1737570 RepID=UPI000C7ED24F|nr:hypothetical protein [Kandeliimicrobium roseum]